MAIDCPTCGAQNPQGAVKCFNCQNTLPQKQLQVVQKMALVNPPSHLLWLPDGSTRKLSGKTVIGSDTSCDVVLVGSGVAPRHAQIEIQSSGIAELAGLNAACRINGTLLPAAIRTPIANNTVIQLGSLSVTYQGPTVSQSSSQSSQSLQPKSQGSQSVQPKSQGGQSLWGQLKTVFGRRPSFMELTEVTGFAQNALRTQDKMPPNHGQLLVVLALLVFAVSLCNLSSSTAVVALVLLIIIVGGLGVSFTSVMVLTMFVKSFLGSQQSQQTAFRVRSPNANTVTAVVLFTDKGGSVVISDNDEVTVRGRMQKNNTIVAGQVEIHSQNGIAMAPPGKITGKMPIPVEVGLILLGCAILTLVLNTAF